MFNILQYLDRMVNTSMSNKSNLQGLYGTFCKLKSLHKNQIGY